jgi:hypothetical protein
MLSPSGSTDAVEKTHAVSLDHAEGPEGLDGAEGGWFMQAASSSDTDTINLRIE